MPLMAAAKAVVGKKIPRLNGRAGSIPALGTIFYLRNSSVVIIDRVQYVQNRTGRLDYKSPPCDLPFGSSAKEL